MRPFTHFLPKASLPFLNLPLLSYSWFYLENLGFTEAICNSHLFLEHLQNTTNLLTTKKIKSSIIFESQSLGSAGGLYNAIQHFKKEENFLYLNGDSLFFPSHLDQLQHFKKDFLAGKFESSFFAAPICNDRDRQSAIWIDRDHVLKFIGFENKMPKKFKANNSKHLKENELRPVKFSGLAFFKNAFLRYLNPNQNHIFLDLMNYHLEDNKYKVFVDEGALVLESGEKESYLQAHQWALDNLFLSPQHSRFKNLTSQNLKLQNSRYKFLESQQATIKSILEKIFYRFDPQDKKVGYRQGALESKKRKGFLLSPVSVEGLDYAKINGFAVFGANTCLFGRSSLTNSILGEGISWQGDLTNQTLIKPSPC